MTLRREFAVLAAWAALLTVLAVAAPGFFRPGNLRVVLVGFAPILVAAVGMTLVIVARHIDLSIGAQFALCAVVAGLLARDGWPMPAVVLAAILTGATVGAVNAAFVAGLRLPSVVVTLATYFVLREGLRWWRQGELIRDLPDSFQWFGLGQDVGAWAVVAAAAAVFLLAAVAARHFAAGRAVYAVGSDADAARLAGLKPAAVTAGVFVLMGALAGLAAVLEGVQLPFVDPKAGTGLEVKAIASAVVGGAAVAGGRGTLAGTLAGVLLLGTIGPALVFLHLRAEWEEAVQGAVILAAVASGAARGGRWHG